MGKGDMKSRKGKLTAGTFGKKRPHKTSKKNTAAAPAKKAEAK